MAERRQCDNCKRDYEALRPRSRFCSAACRVAAHRAHARPAQDETVHSSGPFMQDERAEAKHYVLGDTTDLTPFQRALRAKK